MKIWHSPLFFLLFVPWLIFLIRNIWLGKKRNPSLQFSDLRFLRTARPGIRARLTVLPEILKFVGTALAIVALARPQQADELIKKNVDGIDIMITLDISDSMVIEDMEPLNRLESAKQTIREFIKRRDSDRIGLVLFMGEAFTKVPLTLDYQLILDQLSEIQPSRTIKMGTAIGVAMATAVARLKDSKAKSRVIVFLTDGENNSGMIDPETGLDIAKGYGLRVYTIGIGKDGPTRLPIISKDVFGNKIKRYQPFESTINEELLKKMATETGGKYWRATNTKSFEEIFLAIDNLEKTKVEVNKFTKYTELFPPWLAFGALLYLAAIILESTVLRRAP